jgi:hypothetical protein
LNCGVSRAAPALPETPSRTGHGYIVPLDDDDLIAMLEHIERRDRNAVMGSLQMRFRQLTN